MKYEDFLQKKQLTVQSCGFEVERERLNPMLFDYQKDIVRWALCKGKAAIFADCGLGKTAMQLEWAHQVVKHTGGKVLILTPLAVAHQTAMEAKKFNIFAVVVENQSQAQSISITNYEKLNRFVADNFVGVVLDESSILKSFSGKIRNEIIECFAGVPYKLACTATPSPNDYMELGNHSEFLGVMSRAEMLSMFFVHDGGQTSKWRLKGHAENMFWKWMASWSVFIGNPSDLGYNEQGFNLPELRVHQIIVDGDEPTTESLTLTERRQARHDSLKKRCSVAADLVNQSDDICLVWCDLNDESEKLSNLINDAVEVRGSDNPEYKKNSVLDFSNGNIKCLITKPKIAGFGMNWQICHKMIFVGLSDSYEAYYQAVRRCWRFGQMQPVDVYIVISSKEGCVKDNIEQKQRKDELMKQNMIVLTKEITKKELKKTCRISTPYEPKVGMVLPNWEEMKNASSRSEDNRQIFPL